MAEFAYANCDSRNSVRSDSLEALNSHLYNDVDTKAVLHHLLEQNAQKRIEILSSLCSLIKRNHGNIPFHGTSRLAVFEVLSHVLDDVRWEVRYQCLLLVACILPQLGEDLDICMSLILAKLISNLGHDNSNVSCTSVQIIHWYLRNTNNLQQFLKAFVQFGLESNDYLTRKGSIRSINYLFTEDFACENLSVLIETLAKQLIDGDTTLFYPVFLAMKKIKEIVNNNTFHSYLQRVDDEAVKMYERIEKNSGKNGSDSYSANAALTAVVPASMTNGKVTGVNYRKDVGILLEFCVIDKYTLEKLFSDNWKYRVEALEEIKLSFNQVLDVQNVMSHMTGFLHILSEFLEDNSFKVVLSTLEIFEVLVERLKENMRQCLRSTITIITKYLGDSKAVIREKAIRIIHRLMHYNPPILVLNHIFETKYQRNPRLREEVLNRVIAAVLTFPSYNFEFSYLCETVAPFLVDSKRRVRLAALECFAVLAQAMGTSRIVYLVSAVDAVELNYDSDGLMSAVQARLARRVLPRCSSDGSVLHALCLPSSAGGQNSFLSHTGADIDWIMSASGPLSVSTPSHHRRIATSLPDINNPNWQNKSKNTNMKLVTCSSEKKQYMDESMDKDCEFSDEYGYVESSYFPHYHNQDNKQGRVEENKLYQLQKYSSVNHRLSDVRRGKPNMCRSAKNTYHHHNHHHHHQHHKSISSFEKTSSSSGSSFDTNDTEKYSFESTSPVLSQMTSNVEDKEEGYTTPLNAEDEQLSDGSNFETSNEDQIMKKKSPDPKASLEDKFILNDSPSSADNQSTAVTSFDGFSASCSPDNMGSVGTHLFRYSGNTIAVAEDNTEINKRNEIKVEMIEPVENIIKISPSNNQSSWPVKDISEAKLKEGITTDLWQESPEILPEIYGDHSNISISKITRDRLLKRQQEILKEAEERRVLREKSRQERKQILEQRLQDERERQQRLQEVQQNNDIIQKTNNELSSNEETDDVKETAIAENEVSDNSDSAIVDVSLNSSSTVQTQIENGKLETEVPITPKSSQTLPNNPSLIPTNTSQKFPSSSSLTLFDDKHSRYNPYPNPEEAVKKALRSLASETWTVKINGMQMVSRLAYCHPDVLVGQLHSVNIALLAEVKSLRSSVSRTSILTLGELFLKLKRAMETDLEVIVQTLLHKTGESVGFIRDDIDKTMNYMIDSVSLNKAILAVLLGGNNHRSGAVRKTTAQITAMLVERMGATKCLVGQKEVTERLLPAAARFVMDGVPLTRYYGRKIFYLLFPHPAFDKMLNKFVHQTVIRNIRGILDSIRKKGVGEIPRERISGKVHKVNSSRTTMPSRIVP